MASFAHVPHLAVSFIPLPLRPSLKGLFLCTFISVPLYCVSWNPACPSASLTAPCPCHDLIQLLWRRMQQFPSNNYQTRLRYVPEDHLLRLRVYFKKKCISGFNRRKAICHSCHDYFSLHEGFYPQTLYCPSRGTVICLSVVIGQLKEIHIIITHTNVVMEWNGSIWCELLGESQYLKTWCRGGIRALMSRDRQGKEWVAPWRNGPNRRVVGI